MTDRPSADRYLTAAEIADANPWGYPIQSVYCFTEVHERTRAASVVVTILAITFSKEQSPRLTATHDPSNGNLSVCERATLIAMTNVLGVPAWDAVNQLAHALLHYSMARRGAGVAVPRPAEQTWPLKISPSAKTGTEATVRIVSSDGDGDSDDGRSESPTAPTDRLPSAWACAL
jgi:hypothetical protein